MLPMPPEVWTSIFKPTAEGLISSLASSSKTLVPASLVAMNSRPPLRGVTMSLSPSTTILLTWPLLAMISTSVRSSSSCVSPEGKRAQKMAMTATKMMR